VGQDCLLDNRQHAAHVLIMSSMATVPAARPAGLVAPTDKPLVIKSVVTMHKLLCRKAVDLVVFVCTLCVRFSVGAEHGGAHHSKHTAKQRQHHLKETLSRLAFSNLQLQIRRTSLQQDQEKPQQPMTPSTISSQMAIALTSPSTVMNLKTTSSFPTSFAPHVSCRRLWPTMALASSEQHSSDVNHLLC
jgi:hypothetical protein